MLTSLDLTTEVARHILRVLSNISSLLYVNKIIDHFTQTQLSLIFIHTDLH